MPPRHILLTTDLSEDATRAFAPVAELAHLFGAKVTLLHVAPELLVAAPDASLPAPTLPLDLDRLRQRVREQRRLLPEGLAVDIEVASGTDVAHTVAQCARDRGCDLIALSTHGRSGFRRMVLGSVAEAILRRSSVPVLCYPEHGRG